MKEKVSIDINEESFMDNPNKKKIIIGIAVIALIVCVVIFFMLFSKKQYNVTFDSNGGTSVGAIVVDENGLIVKPEDPTRENYMFAGWYYNDELYDFSKPVTGDIKLEARWIELTEDVSGVELDQTELTLGVGKKAKLIAKIMPENAKDKSVTWSSSDSDVVSVDSEGNITAKKAGTATITVTTKDGGYKADVKVTVSKDAVSVTGVSLNKTSLSLKVNESATLTTTIKPSNATNKNVTWSSSNPDIVSVSASGKVTAKSAGTATITVTTKDGSYKATCKVTVTSVKVTGVSLNKTSLSLKVNETSTLTATVNPSNATNKNVTWSSDNASIVTVDSNGKVTAKSAGTATITVTTKDGSKTATCKITVTNVEVTGVSLNKGSLSLYVDGTDTLTATVNPSNATNKDVTWSSSDNNVATVDQNGKVIAKGVGTVTITVTTKDGNKTATCEVTVSEKPANYVVTLSPIVQEVTGAVLQYSVAVTKDGNAFSDYKVIKYGDVIVKTTTMSSVDVDKNITSVKIVLSNSEVTATVVYR